MTTPGGSLLNPEEAAGRACYEGFFEAMAEWIPERGLKDWADIGDNPRAAWIAAAKAAQRTSS